MLALEVLAKDPSRRPSARALVERLEGLLAEASLDALDALDAAFRRAAAAERDVHRVEQELREASFEVEEAERAHRTAEGAQSGEADIAALLERHGADRLGERYAETRAALRQSEGMLRDALSAERIALEKLRDAIETRSLLYWYDKYADIYPALLSAAELKNVLRQLDLQFESASEGIARYKSTYWKIDQLYRHFRGGSEFRQAISQGASPSCSPAA